MHCPNVKGKEDESIARRIEDERRREAELDGASDPAEIARLLRPGGVGAEHCLGPWDRLVASGALGAPPHEMVTVAIKSKRLFFGNAAREEDRIGAWRYNDPFQCGREWQLIDEAGTLWDEDRGAPGISKYTILPKIGTHTVSRGDQFVAVARGGEVVMRVRGGAPGWTLEGGRPMHRFAMRGGERFPIAVLGVIDANASERPAG